MGIRNTSGMRVQCNHCGYVWLTNSEREVTSCPNCGWRVRLTPSKKVDLVGGRALTTSRPREPLI